MDIYRYSLKDLDAILHWMCTEHNVVVTVYSETPGANQYLSTTLGKYHMCRQC